MFKDEVYDIAVRQSADLEARVTKLEDELAQATERIFQQDKIIYELISRLNLVEQKQVDVQSIERLGGARVSGNGADTIKRNLKATYAAAIEIPSLLPVPSDETVAQLQGRVEALTGTRFLDPDLLLPALCVRSLNLFDTMRQRGERLLANAFEELVERGSLPRTCQIHDVVSALAQQLKLRSLLNSPHTDYNTHVYAICYAIFLENDYWAMSHIVERCFNADNRNLEAKEPTTVLSTISRQLIDSLRGVCSKSQLHELAQKLQLPKPEYDTKTEGPDSKPNFRARVTWQGLEATGAGRAKKEAEQAAAGELLEHIKKNVLQGGLEQNGPG